MTRRQAERRPPGRLQRSAAATLASCVAAALMGTACGKKGPPLAPLHLVPNPPASVSVRRLGDDVELRFVLPTANANGPGRVELDHVELYAATVAPGAPVPPNRELMSAKYAIGSVPVKPPAVEGKAPENPAEDNRPEPGGAATFVERLTPDKLNPLPVVAPLAGAADTPPAAAEASAAPLPTYPSRVYVLRGITRGGRPGQPSPRVAMPLVTPPAAPVAVTTSYTESAVLVSWTPPATLTGETAVMFNVYAAGSPAPINPEPLAAPPFERAGITFGSEECFSVRSVETVATVPIESTATAPSCVTPRDTFAPAAPKGLSGVAGPGAISLIWDANTERDLAGYVVLRGEAPGDTLQPLTPSPIAGTSFEDKTVKPGVRYVYAIVAVDKATPPNTSALSIRWEETAR